MKLCVHSTICTFIIHKLEEKASASLGVVDEDFGSLPRPGSVSDSMRFCSTLWITPPL